MKTDLENKALSPGQKHCFFPGLGVRVVATDETEARGKAKEKREKIKNNKPK